MAHPMVEQLRFARSEFRRGLEGVADSKARKRLMPINAISWMIGHLAWQEQRYWLQAAQGRVLLPEVKERFAYGAPGTAPPLEEVWAAWETITQAADPWLDGLDGTRVGAPLADGQSSVGTYLYRTTYHYWYHLGEAMAVRQLLGDAPLPDFVGDIDSEAPYRPAA